MRQVAIVLAAAALAAPAGAQDSPAAVLPAGAEQAGQAITAESLKAHVRFLSDDLLEGRAPATRGDRIAQLYVATQFEALGLEPGAPGGGWFQPFDIVGVTTSHGPAQLQGQGGSLRLEPGTEFIGFAGNGETEIRVEKAEVVFVGYGIVAAEYGWDDFKGADLRGKILLVMNNDPAGDPELFGGDTRLYYGRWTYKYEEAARQGALGAIVIHTPRSAGYGWQVVRSSWSSENFSLPHEGGPRLPLVGWATEDASRRLVALGGQDLDALRAAAERRDFRPVALGVQLDLLLTSRITRAQTANVIARLPGGDPGASAEAVIYTAHHDHLGRKHDAEPGEDDIFNGAMDNASGVAGLLDIAAAFTALPERPRRSVLFAAVAAEEQGLLGSAYLAAHPPVPAGRLAADINVDGLNILGPTRDLTMVGRGKSSLDATIDALAARLGREIKPDQFPDRGFFYRSDQFNFARFGVPAAYFDPGTEVVGKPEGWGREQAERFENEDYHQPSDELKDTWRLDGAVQDCRFFFDLGLLVANAAAMPSWNPGDEFEAARVRALAALTE